MHFSRRSIIKFGAAACLAGLTRPSTARGAGPEARRFLLAIQIQPGVDWSYLVDARGPKLTDKQLQQNYLYKNENSAAPPPTPEEFTADKIAERTITTDLSRSTALISPLVKDLWTSHKDRLSIVNGVYMLRANAGHFENTTYLFANSSFANTPIYPPTVGSLLGGGAPIDALILRESSQMAPSNLANSAELASFEVAQLATTLSGGPQIDEGSLTWRHLLARADEGAALGGQFGTGSGNWGSGLRRARATGAAFAGVTNGEPADEPVSLVQTVRRALIFFSRGLTSVATILHDANVDAHDAGTCQTAATVYGDLATQISAMVDLLKNTMFVDPETGASTPFIDLTTFIITSEFGRTMRSLAFPKDGSILQTGTDHNPLSNSMIVGGRGIRPGLIVGESDLRDCDDNGVHLDVSDAHREKNPKLDQVMGKPFNFTTQQVENGLPNAWRETDYICMPSVTNTILDALNITTEHHFKLGSSPAPILRVLRSS